MRPLRSLSERFAFAFRALSKRCCGASVGLLAGFSRSWRRVLGGCRAVGIEGSCRAITVISQGRFPLGFAPFGVIALRGAAETLRPNWRSTSKGNGWPSDGGSSGSLGHLGPVRVALLGQGLWPWFVQGPRRGNHRENTVVGSVAKSWFHRALQRECTKHPGASPPGPQLAGVGLGPSQAAARHLSSFHQAKDRVPPPAARAVWRPWPRVGALPELEAGFRRFDHPEVNVD